MLFSSIPFLYYFLPCVLIVYFIVPKCLKNVALLIFSLLFYAWGEPGHILIMMTAILLGYFFGLLLEKYRGQPLSRLFLLLSIFISVGMLVYFKYADFLVEAALPIGISFYTFQLLSYTIDVYRGNVRAQRNPVFLATYIALFPQLIAGPIVRYSQVAEQLSSRTHKTDQIASGIRRFILGLSKKILISNTLGELCAIFRSSQDKSVLFYWIYAISFMLHIYFDFSGYSDMAIGLGRIFGFDFPENFNYPYISSSITEFWRRWHISLGSWFRDYVYIPLGGNRVSKKRFFCNILIVWLLTGLWHGAAWNFILWGLYFAVLLLLEKRWIFILPWKFLRHICVLFLICLSFVIFNASSLREAGTDFLCMFGFGRLSLVSTEALYYLKSYLFVFLIAIIGATPLPKKTLEYLQQKKAGDALLSILEPVFLVLLMIINTAYLVDGSFQPFLYFRF